MPPDADCVFCKIVAGTIPAAVIHQTSHALAFLDVNPLSDGHILVIPRDHYVHLDDMPEEDCRHVMELLPMLGRALRRATGALGYNVLQNNGKVSGQAVSHVHVHLIPRVQDDGLGYRWNAGQYPPGRADEIASAYRAALA